MLRTRKYLEWEEVYANLHGVIQPDLSHAGQIAILK